MIRLVSRGCFTHNFAKGLVSAPEDREPAVRKLIEGAGGRLVNCYFTTGDTDFIIISEANEAESIIGVCSRRCCLMGENEVIRRLTPERSAQRTKAPKPIVASYQAALRLVASRRDELDLNQRAEKVFHAIERVMLPVLDLDPRNFPTSNARAHPRSKHRARLVSLFPNARWVAAKKKNASVSPPTSANGNCDQGLFRLRHRVRKWPNSKRNPIFGAHRVKIRNNDILNALRRADARARRASGANFCYNQL